MNTYQVVQEGKPVIELATYVAAVYWLAEKFNLAVEQRREVKRTGKLEQAGAAIQRVKHNPTN